MIRNAAVPLPRCHLRWWPRFVAMGLAGRPGRMTWLASKPAMRKRRLQTLQPLKKGGPA